VPVNNDESNERKEGCFLPRPEKEKDTASIRGKVLFKGKLLQGCGMTWIRLGHVGEMQTVCRHSIEQVAGERSRLAGAVESRVRRNRVPGGNWVVSRQYAGGLRLVHPFSKKGTETVRKGTLRDREDNGRPGE